MNLTRFYTSFKEMPLCFLKTHFWVGEISTHCPSRSTGCPGQALLRSTTSAEGTSTSGPWQKWISGNDFGGDPSKQQVPSAATTVTKPCMTIFSCNSFTALSYLWRHFTLIHLFCILSSMAESF